jgi:hypothetical protein
MWSQLLRVWVVASLAALPIVAEGRETEQIVVSVFNRAGANPATVRAAEKMAARIYEQVGISIAWRNCRTQAEPELERCEAATDHRQLVLNIEHQPRTLVADAFGVAFLGNDGWGTFCDVFYDRILELHRGGRASEETIVGMVMAHELGHLLLGSNSHSDTGIMRPKWQSENFLAPLFEVTKFSRQQEQKISDRLKQVGRK